MPRTKDQALSIRTTTAEVKAFLRQAAARERRSVASMVEVMVLSYAAQCRLLSAGPVKPALRKDAPR